MEPMLPGVLIYFHCPSDSGFAISRLEKVFFRMAVALTGDAQRVHFAYSKILPNSTFSELPLGSTFELDPRASDTRTLGEIKEAVQSRSIVLALGFDQQPGLPIYRVLRAAGVARILSYWGAPMSSINSGWRLALKRLQVRLLRSTPDHYIFESESMRRTATHGRGVAGARTSVVYLGVDCEQFKPAAARSTYAHEVFSIPHDAHIIFYSGHMEPRKGIAVLLRTARLIAASGRKDIYFLLLGNRPGEIDQYRDIYAGTPAEKQVVFGGYRSDIALLMQSAAVGVIASTGWDSFTRSAVEMSATGLPLLVSRLQGLQETIEEGETGFSFSPGEEEQLSRLVVRLVDDEPLRVRLGAAARARSVRSFSEDRQVESLVRIARMAPKEG
jgi:glycosyltransferase involved in cell wall biosynthesis